MVQLTGNEFHVLVLALSWTLGFLPRFLGKKLTWVQCVGLALVIHPFVRMGIGFLRTYELLFVPTVLEPASPIALWRSVENQIWYNLMLPLVGLFLLHSPFADTAGDSRLVRSRFGDALAEHGVAPRASVRTDVQRALSLFLLLAAIMLAAWVASRFVTGILSPGSDESAYWRNITIPLIILLGLAPGLAEEFLFRGLLLTQLARRMPWIAAALAQAFLFALIHAGYGTWTHIIGPFLFGLGMAFIARELGVIVTALLHAQANIVFFTAEVAPTYLAVHGALGLAALLAVSGALLIACVYALVATRGDAIRLLVAGAMRALGIRRDEGPQPIDGPRPG